MIKLFNNTSEIPVKQWKFPAGELGVKIEGDISEIPELTISLLFQNSDCIISMLLLVDAIRNINKDAKITLYIPYFPYARQDRVCAEGESFSLRVIANLIASCKFNKVLVQDMHSTVLDAFFEAGVLCNKEQHLIAQEYIKDKKNFALVSPDAGATKKIYTLAKTLGVEVIEAKKIRSVEDGKILATSIDNSSFNKYNELVVVDDICDGGRTFIELAKVIRESFNGVLTLVVTHGIFSQGFGELNKYYNEIYFENDLRKEK